MSLRLCVECGRRAPRPPKPCERCGADATVWKAAPTTLRAFAARIARALFCIVLAALLFFAAFVLCTEWAFPSWIARVLQVLVALVVVIFGGLTGLAMLLQAGAELFERHFRHEGDGRSGTARATFGFVREAHGTFTRTSVFAPGAPELEAVAVFANLHARNPELARALQVRMPSSIDVVVTTAILGLASRGRCELVLRTTRSWNRAEDRVPKPAPDQHHVLIRSGALRHALPIEPGVIESAILTALDTFAVAASTSPQTSHGPYREKVQEVLEGSAPVPIDLLVAALTGGRPKARSWLRAKLQEEAKRDPARSRLGTEAVAKLAGTFTALFAHAKDGTIPPSTALLFQVSRALSTPVVRRG